MRKQGTPVQVARKYYSGGRCAGGMQGSSECSSVCSGDERLETESSGAKETANEATTCCMHHDV